MRSTQSCRQWMPAPASSRFVLAFRTAHSCDSALNGQVALCTAPKLPPREAGHHASTTTTASRRRHLWLHQRCSYRLTPTLLFFET